MQEILGVLAGIVFVVGFLPYGWAILQKKTQPKRSTWITYAAVDSIIFAGMIAEGAVNGQMVGVIIGVWVILALSLKYGAPGWTRLDKFCLFGAAIGITAWQVFSSPVLGIVLSLTVMFVGSIPTFASAWKNPQNEDKLGWTLFWVSCVFAVAAIPAWTLADAAQPLVFFLIESIMMCILYIRPAFRVE